MLPKPKCLLWWLNLLAHQFTWCLCVGEWTLQPSGEGSCFLGQDTWFSNLLILSVVLGSHHFMGGIPIQSGEEISLPGWPFVARLGSETLGLHYFLLWGKWVGWVNLRAASLLCSSFRDRGPCYSSFLISPFKGLFRLLSALFPEFVSLFCRGKQIERSLSHFVQTRIISVFSVTF